MIVGTPAAEVVTVVKIGEEGPQGVSAVASSAHVDSIIPPDNGFHFA